MVTPVQCHAATKGQNWDLGLYKYFVWIVCVTQSQLKPRLLRTLEEMETQALATHVWEPVPRLKSGMEIVFVIPTPGMGTQEDPGVF